MKFVAPEMKIGEGQAFSSASMLLERSEGGVFPQERLREMPDELIYAMAAALNDAAAEMEVRRRARVGAAGVRVVFSPPRMIHTSVATCTVHTRSTQPEFDV